MNEEQLRARLSAIGKSQEEIDQLINEHIDATSSPTLDIEAIAELLSKAQRDTVLRVRPFKLTKEQYDALASYYEEASANRPGSELDANYLVSLALEEFTKQIG